MEMNQIVLVDLTKSIDPELLQQAATALNEQVTQHLAKTWDGINASVTSASKLSSVTPSQWPVFLVKSLPPGEGGYHQDKKNQPYAKVIASPNDPSWTIDASHEICEMLVDPYGSRTTPSQAIAIQGNGVVDAAGTFQYLVEACDPCEANEFAYVIQGIAVSDFITPNFYDASVRPGTLYSYRGNITRPRELLKGGYISFTNAAGAWEQILWVDPGPPVLNPLSSASDKHSYQEAVRVAKKKDYAVTSLREAVHLDMSDKETEAKHHQRRKAGGLPKAVQARVDEFSRRRTAESAAACEEALAVQYGLNSQR